MSRKLRVAFIHPDLGIGGAERLVVDAAVGLQNLGHTVDVYTSHHDPSHCFEETRDGTLNVHYIKPPFPRAWKGKFHILFAHARQLHLTAYLLSRSAPKYDVYFVDQLSTCVPLLRALGHTRVVFYCHFPDKLLADGAYVAGKKKAGPGLLKRVYRLPMDFLEEVTTRQADVILVNSRFTAGVFREHFPSISRDPTVVYPGINFAAYEGALDDTDPDIRQVASDRPTLLSLNRFEKKKNVELAIHAFRRLRGNTDAKDLRLVLAGGYDPRLQDNVETLAGLVAAANTHELTFTVIAPASAAHTIPEDLSSASTPSPDVLFLLNFATPQRSALLSAPSTRCLLYTPANEHFGIVPVEAMACGVPVLACDSGGPTESVRDAGWLRRPEPGLWAEALEEIVALPPAERAALGERTRRRARELFGMEAMARGIERALEKAVRMGPVGVPGVGWALVLVLVAFLAWMVGRA